MALIVEDGTGLAGAESYCSVSFADTYHSGRGNAAWAALATPGKEAALRRATDFMQQAYGGRWLGYAMTEEQALSWPRTSVARRLTASGYGYWAEDAVPTAVQRACAELALRAANGPLLGDQGRLTKREKVDVIEVEYADNAPVATQYPAIDAMLAEFFDSVTGGAARTLVRT